MASKLIESIGITKCLVLDKRWNQWLELEQQCKVVKFGKGLSDEPLN